MTKGVFFLSFTPIAKDLLSVGIHSGAESNVSRTTVSLK